MDAEADTDASDAHGPAIGDLAHALYAASGDGVAATLAAVTAVLFARHLRFDAADTAWPDRDRLLLGGTASSLAPRLAALLGTTPDLTDSFDHTADRSSGQSLAAATGAALAERMLAARYGRSLVDHRIWLLLDDNELCAGAAQEAAALAGQSQLGRLTVIAAVNAPSCPSLARFTALGWTLRRIDAGDVPAASAALSASVRSRKPTLIAVRTKAEAASPASQAMATASWAFLGHRSAGARRAWLKRLKRHTSREDFDRTMLGQLPPRWHMALAPPDPPGRKLATAQAVDAALQRVASINPGLGGVPGPALIGMALHGGILPVGRKPLADSDAIRPGLRLAATLGRSVVQLLIEPAEPCPTGGLRTALRAMRNVHVFRPADAAEALICLELALRRARGPSVLLLAQTPADLGERAPHQERQCVRGGYVLRAPDTTRDITLIASGAELALALEAATALAADGVAAAVVSLPCWELFAAQDCAYRHMVLGDAPRLGIEAGCGFGWERHLGTNGIFLGPREFGLHPATIVAASLAAIGAGGRRKGLLERTPDLLETADKLT